MRSLRQDLVRYALFLAFPAACLLVAVGWFVGQETVQEQSFLCALNDARDQAGAPPLLPEWGLRQASRWQAQHMTQTDEVEHNRLTNKGWLDGLESPEDRRMLAFYFDLASETLSQVAGEGELGPLRTLLDAPYHRITLLDPAVQAAGIGLAFHTKHSAQYVEAAPIVGDYLDAPHPTPVVCPALGANDVPPAFRPASEVPNPAPESQVVGYIITFQTGLGLGLSVSEFALREKYSGRLLQGRVAAHPGDRHMRQGGASFIPAQPLEWGTTYIAQFSGQVDARQITKQWEFSTQSRPDYFLKIIDVDRAAATFIIDYAGPVHPIDVCWRRSKQAQVLIKGLSARKKAITMQSCGPGVCAVQVFLSAQPGCKEKTVKVGALFDADSTGTHPVLTEYFP